MLAIVVGLPNKATFILMSFGNDRLRQFFDCANTVREGGINQCAEIFRANEGKKVLKYEDPNIFKSGSTVP